MPTVRLFAAAKDAAGTGRDAVAGATVGEVLAAAVDRWGEGFAAVLERSRVWVNGEPASPDDPVGPDDEVAVLPPVSGGAVEPAPPRAAPAGRAPASPARPAARGADPTLLVERLFAPADTDGPKAVLGLAWAVAQALAVLGGRFALAVLFGLVAAVAGLHAARAWRRAGARPSRAVAGVLPLLAPMAAAVGTALGGVVVLGGVTASLVMAAIGRGSRRSLLGSAGATVRCWLAPSLAATSVVLVHRIDPATVAALLVLLAAYDAGAYLWGSDADGPLVGRVAGIIAVGVMSFALGVVQLVVALPPFQSMSAVLIFGGLAATLAPLGQLLASAVLPQAAAEAPALRRLDALLLAGPAWAFALWGYVG